MSFIWDSVKQVAEKAGQAALVGGTIAKLKTEIIILDRDIISRQHKFGVELYDYVEPLSHSPEFFAANDRMTDTIRGPLLAAQREIAALNIRRDRFKEKLSKAEVDRKSAFPKAATTIGEKVINAGKAARLAGNEVKTQTDVSVTETLMKSYKHEFGVKMYTVLVELEDRENWLPTVRDIRSIYDQTRREIEKLEEKKMAKKKELKELNGNSNRYAVPKNPNTSESHSMHITTPEVAPTSASIMRQTSAPISLSNKPYPLSSSTHHTSSNYASSPASFTNHVSAMSSASSLSTPGVQPVPINSFDQSKKMQGHELFAGIIPHSTPMMLTGEVNHNNYSCTMKSQKSLNPPTQNNLVSNATVSTQEFDPFSVFDGLTDQNGSSASEY
mmetsp:Transcript_1085/g.1383  ORF Transcript_1085/g.1383 Transcript_1085/m.1383 type:complete len:386 (+) Transcript_1085:101-1258(+)